MKFYPNRFMAVAVAIFSLFFIQSACKRDIINCKDEKQGSVSFDQKTKDFYPLKGTETLVFQSQAGTEMQFKCDSPNISRYPMHVERLCQGADLQEHFGYFDADSKIFQYKSSSSMAPVQFELNLMTANAILKNKDETALYDYFTCVLFDGEGGSEISLLLSDRGTNPALLTEVKNNQRFDFFASKKIGGKAYSNIYAGQPVFGSPAGSKTVVYFQKNKGVVAFSLADGTVFLLQ